MQITGHSDKIQIHKDTLNSFPGQTWFILGPHQNLHGVIGTKDGFSAGTLNTIFAHSRNLLNKLGLPAGIVIVS